MALSLCTGDFRLANPKSITTAGRRDNKLSYALFYIDINEHSRHYGGVYYQRGSRHLETQPHDPDQPPRWKSFADFAQYVYFSQGDGSWCSDMWED